MNKIITVSAFLGASAVILGAFGAHGLKNILESSYLEAYKTGVLYQMFHALALFGLGIFYSHSPSLKHSLQRIAISWYLGIFFFSGSLYLLSWLTQIHKILGLITPLGGLFFIIGWIQLFLLSLKNPSQIK